MPPRPRWSIEEVLRLLLWVAASFVFSGLVQGWISRTGISPWKGLVLGQLTFDAMVLIAVHRFLRAHGVGWRTGLGINQPHSARSFGIGLLAGMAFLPAAYGLQAIFVRLLMGLGVELPPQHAVELLVSAGSWGRGWVYLTAGLAAPVVEEIIFRGVLFAAIRETGWFRTALFGTAVLFGAIHFNLSVLVPLSAFGVLLALLLDRTGSLLAPIAAHMVFNAAPFAMLLLGVQFQEASR